MSQYKATYQYLHEIGYLENKPKDLMEFGEEVWYFERINNQRIQNMKCELSKADLLEAYNDYIENPPVNLSDCKLVMHIDRYWDDEDIVFLKYDKNEYSYYHRAPYWFAYLYSIQKKVIYRRVIQQRAWTDEKYFRHGKTTHNIFDFITK